MKKILLTLGVALSGFAATAQYFSASTGADFQNFSAIDLDGDGFNWGIYDLNAQGTALDSYGEIFGSQSYDGQGQAALTPDNFLFTPVINLTGVTGTVAVDFKVGSVDTDASGYYEEYVSVYVTDGFNGLPAALAAPIHEDVLAGGEEMFYFAYDISSMAGADSVMIVFRHHNCTDEDILFLDDINVTNTLGVNQNVISSTVYPNPATDMLNVDMVGEEIAEVTIVSLDGKNVLTTNNGKIDVSALVSGMYIYNVTTKTGKLSTGNFVKK